MAYVQKFDRSMIERFLRTENLHFLRDSDGDFVLELPYSDDTGCSIKNYLMISARFPDIYRILITSDKRIPKNDWGRAVMVCNTWNKERFWPKAYLSVRDPADTYGTIVLEWQADFEKGVHQELLDDFSMMILSSGITFWKWAHQEQGF